MMTIAIRRAEARDISAIAAIHVDCWRETYRGMLAEPTLRALDVTSREAAWQHAMREGAGFRDILVAERNRRIVGFGSCGLAWDADLGVEGEIEALYVRKKDQLKGIGTCLMGAMAAALGAHKMRSCGLWVARDNLAAVSFCRTLGGNVSGSRDRAIGGAIVPSVGIVWTDLSDLAAWNVAVRVTHHHPRRPGEGDARWQAAGAR